MYPKAMQGVMIHDRETSSVLSPPQKVFPLAAESVAAMLRIAYRECLCRPLY